MTLLACAVAVAAGACSSGNASIPAPRAVEKSSAIDAGDRVCTAMANDQ